MLSTNIDFHGSWVALRHKKLNHVADAYCRGESETIPPAYESTPVDGFVFEMLFDPCIIFRFWYIEADFFGMRKI